jgi:hypothetical protein
VIGDGNAMGIAGQVVENVLRRRTAAWRTRPSLGGRANVEKNGTPVPAQEV